MLAAGLLLGRDASGSFGPEGSGGSGLFPLYKVCLLPVQMV